MGRLVRNQRRRGRWCRLWRRWQEIRGAEIKWVKFADGCEEREDAEPARRICLERTGNQEFRFGQVTSSWETFMWKRHIGHQT